MAEYYGVFDLILLGESNKQSHISPQIHRRQMNLTTCLSQRSKNMTYSSMSRILIFFIVFLLRLLVVSSSSFSVGQHPRSTNYAIELNGTNFDVTLRGARTSYAIVEFYAHWCPACRNYKPHFEKVARLFNGPGAVYPGIIMMARVDCAQKINTNLCEKFSIAHFPMLYWGPPSKFLAGGFDPQNKDKNDLRTIVDGRNANHLLSWINTQLSSSYDLEDERYQNEQIPLNISDMGKIEEAIYDVEEATSTAFDIILKHKMIKPRNRSVLIKFLQLMVAHHPSRRCRRGSADVLVNFDDLWPSDGSLAVKLEPVKNSSKGALENFNICGIEVPRGHWVFCRGSRNETRGFSCGLWVLLHSLSVRIEDGESYMAFTAICEFVNNFFICEECRQHFHEMCSSVTGSYTRRHDFVLWLWNAHNKVNERLITEEKSLGTGDPNFPKMIWPHKQLCPSCYKTQGRKDYMRGHIDWDYEEVYKLLVSFYGEPLLNLNKSNNDSLIISNNSGIHAEGLGEPTTAVVVPVGTALSIAIASCAFGALAWFWRIQQKSHKYLYIHTFKNI